MMAEKIGVVFGRMLAEGVRKIAYVEERKVVAVQDELGKLVRRSGKDYIQYLCKGHLPREADQVEVLAAQLVQRGRVDELWLRAFLHSANRPEIDVDRLCNTLLFQSIHPELTRHLRTDNQVQLFGVEHVIDAIVKAMDSDYMISIQGIGGIGKTALADAVARRFIRQSGTNLTGVLWVMVEQTRPFANLPSQESVSCLQLDVVLNTIGEQLGLRQFAHHDIAHKKALITEAMQGKPYLIVIDNLHSSSDVDLLMPLLLPIANPTRIVLTVRQAQPFEYIRSFELPELSLAALLKLILYRGRTIGWIRELDEETLIAQAQRDGAFGWLLTASDVRLQYLGRIIEIAGGNPLAILLIVGQLHSREPHTVFKDFTIGVNEAHDSLDLYNRIYRSLWQTSSPDEKDVLRLMGDMTITGVSYVDLARWANELGLTEPRLRSAILKLQRKMLLMVDTSSPTTYYYRIHQLTHTFIRHSIFQLIY